MINSVSFTQRPSILQRLKAAVTPAPATQGYENLQASSKALWSGSVSSTQLSQQAATWERDVQRAAGSSATPAELRPFLAAMTGESLQGVPQSDLVQELAANLGSLRPTAYLGAGLDTRRDETVLYPTMEQGFTPVLVAEILQKPGCGGPDRPAVVHLEYRYPLRRVFDDAGTSVEDRQNVHSLYFLKQRSDAAELEAMIAPGRVEAPVRALDDRAMSKLLKSTLSQLEKASPVSLHTETFHGDYIGEGRSAPSPRLEVNGLRVRPDLTRLVGTLVTAGALVDILGLGKTPGSVAGLQPPPRSLPAPFSSAMLSAAAATTVPSPAAASAPPAPAATAPATIKTEDEWLVIGGLRVPRRA